MLHRSATTKKEAKTESYCIAGPRNNNVVLASNTRAEAAGKEDDLLQVDTGEVENNTNEDNEKRGGSVSVVTSIVDTILDGMYYVTMKYHH